MRLYHVTDVLRLEGLIPEADEEAAIEGTLLVTRLSAADRAYHLERGRAVHAATALADQDDLDASGLSDEVRRRVEAWGAFARDFGDIIAIEQPVEDHILGYCGTLDRIFDAGGRVVLVDIKGSTRARWHALQLAAYRADRDRRGTIHMAGCAYWTGDRYSFVEYGHGHRWLVEDFATFKSALQLRRWKDGGK